MNWNLPMWKSWEPVSFAWNADIVCLGCAEESIEVILMENFGETAESLAGMNVMELRSRWGYLLASARGLFTGDWEEWGDGAAESVMGGFDSTSFPSIVTAGDEGSFEDTCGNCHHRIEGTV